VQPARGESIQTSTESAWTNDFSASPTPPQQRDRHTESWRHRVARPGGNFSGQNVTQSHEAQLRPASESRRMNRQKGVDAHARSTRCASSVVSIHGSEEIDTGMLTICVRYALTHIYLGDYRYWYANYMCKICSYSYISGRL
jgi:hypothetical protein